MTELHGEPQPPDNGALVMDDLCDEMLESAAQPLANYMPLRLYSA